MKNLLVLLLFALGIIIYSSCKQDEIIVSDPGRYLKYFPLETGYWIEYEADSIIHLGSDDIYAIDTAIDRYHFYVREQVDSSFIDAEGKKAYVVLRFKRNSDTLNWNLFNVWTARVDGLSAQRTEDNLRFVKLSFPFNKRSEWNGNAFNFMAEEQYSYDDLFVPASYNNLNFDSSVVVLQNDFMSNINKIYKKEIYAPNAGMIFKQVDSVRTLLTTNGFIILTGVEYQLKITDYKR